MVQAIAEKAEKMQASGGQWLHVTATVRSPARSWALAIAADTSSTKW
jgi:hypothetical protein